MIVFKQQAQQRCLEMKGAIMTLSRASLFVVFLWTMLSTTQNGLGAYSRPLVHGLPGADQNQMAADCLTLSSQSQKFSSLGGTGSFSIVASGGSCPWTVRSESSWITLTSIAMGDGNATITFTVLPTISARRQANHRQ